MVEPHRPRPVTLWFSVDQSASRGPQRFVDRGGARVAPDGLTYVMQACSLAVDPGTEEARLLTLCQRLAPPAGWKFQVRAPEEELLVDTTHTVARCSRTSSSIRTPCRPRR